MHSFFSVICLVAIMAMPPAHSFAASARADSFDSLGKALFFRMKQRKAKIPPLAPGQIRIKAPLNSLCAGGKEIHYPPDDESNSTLSNCRWENSRFGVMGQVVENGFLTGNLWFFADIDAETGEIITVKSYGQGACHPAFEVAFMLGKKLDGSYGNIGKQGFEIKVCGRGVYEFSQHASPGVGISEYALIVLGEKSILEAKNGEKIPLKFYFSQKSDIKADDTHRNMDRGTGMATIERNDSKGAQVVLSDKAMKGDAGTGAAHEKNSDIDGVCKALYFDENARTKPVRQPGQGHIRIRGPLNSLSPDPDNFGCSWSGSKYGIYGREKDHGNLWFLADIDASTGKIVSVYAYGNGECMPGRKKLAFLSWKPVKDTFGNVGANGFELKSKGTGVEAAQSSKPRVGEAFEILVSGQANLLEAENGQEIPVTFHLSNDGNVEKRGKNMDCGVGIAIVERNGNLPGVPGEQKPQNGAANTNASEVAAPESTVARNIPADFSSPADGGQKAGAGQEASRAHAPTSPPLVREQGDTPSESGNKASSQKMEKKNEPYTIILD